MSMERVTIRVPRDVLRAYDSANGNRSALMRRRLSEAVRDGELDGVDADLQTLAEREAIVESGALPRKRATFKSRCHDFFAGRWESGGVTGDDADILADTWRREAALYGEDHIAYCEAIVEWYRSNYRCVGEKASFPDADTFVRKAREIEPAVTDELVSVLSNAADAGADREQAVGRLRSNYEPDVIEAAAERVFEDGETA